MNVNKYRFDNRTKEEFERDIKDGTAKEAKLLKLWLKNIEKKTGKKPIYKNNGCGPTGEYLSQSDINTDADFIVEPYGKVEVKFSKTKIDTSFHLKVGQVRSYIEQNACILMVNGADTDTPTFIIISNKEMQKISQECSIINFSGFGGKPSYKIPINRYIWELL